MVWLEGTGPAVVLIVFLIRSFPAAEQTRAKRREQEGKNQGTKAKQAEQAVTIYFLSKDKSEIVVYCFWHNESIWEWIVNGIVSRCYYCVTAEINNLAEQKPAHRQKEDVISLMSLSDVISRIEYLYF